MHLPRSKVAWLQSEALCLSLQLLFLIVHGAAHHTHTIRLINGQQTSWASDVGRPTGSSTASASIAALRPHAELRDESFMTEVAFGEHYLL